jgi:hypothetical protein
MRIAIWADVPSNIHIIGAPPLQDDNDVALGAAISCQISDECLVCPHDEQWQPGPVLETDDGIRVEVMSASGDRVFGWRPHLASSSATTCSAATVAGRRKGR